MLPHPTLDKLQTLRLHGMLKALAEQLKTPDIDSLSFEERLGLLVDRELTERDDKRLSSRLRPRQGADPATERQPVAARRPQPDHQRPHRRR